MFEVLDEVCNPSRGTKYSAGIDLRARLDMMIAAGESVLIPLGVKLDMQKVENIYSNQELWRNCHYIQLMLRSSLSEELIIANGVGIIDMDYEGEIMIRVHYPHKSSSFISQEPYYIERGQRVAQVILLEHKSRLFGIDSEECRTGGFGSTGEK